MKKILAIVLVCFLTLSFVACGGNEESSTPATSNGNTDTSTPADDDSSVAEDSSVEDSTDDSSDVSDSSSDESAPEDEKVVMTNKFISWGKHIKEGIVSVKATDSTSLQISRVDQAKLLAGDVAVFTPAYGLNIPADLDYSEFAIAVFEYDAKVYSYVKKSVSEIGKGDSATTIPEDGYVLVIHKDFKSKIDAISKTAKNTAFFPHGLIINTGLYSTIAKKTAKLDGKVSASEYGKAIWTINQKNDLVSYAQFGDNIYAEAEVYLTYDKDNLYLGVIVSSPYHNNPLTQEKAGDMYNHDCIQINVSSEPANGEYMIENYDYENGGKAVKDKVVRQYGFAANDKGETISCNWFPGDKEFKAKSMCSRDDASQKTIYEVSIPWSEIGSEDHPVDVKKGESFGFSISINCGDGKTFKNITLRDGGGIIGRNDFSKVPVITFG